MSTNVPKARLLTLKELIGVDDPNKLGITSKTSYQELEQLSDQTKDKLQIFKKRGILCEAAIGYRCPGDYEKVYTKNGYKMESPSGYLIETQCKDERNMPLMPSAFGYFHYGYGPHQFKKLRVAFNWSEIKGFCQNITRAEDGVLEADYGLWMINDPEHYWIEDELLEALYQHWGKLNLLSKTPLSYTIMSTNSLHTTSSIQVNTTNYPVYEFQGEKYAKRLYDEYGYIHKWTTLRPIHLWIDEETDTAVSQNTILKYLSHTFIDEYLANYFSKDIFESAIYLQKEQKTTSGMKNSDDEKPMFPGIEIEEPPKVDETQRTLLPKLEQKEEEKPMFPGIEIEESPKVDETQRTSLPKPEQEEKPLFPGIEISSIKKIEEVPKKSTAKQIVKVRLRPKQDIKR